MSTGFTKGRVLIIVENLPVPNDRRVWLEATTLYNAGYTVSAISIKGKNATKSYEVLEGIHVYRYPAPLQTKGVFSFLVEFSYCWIMTLLLSVVISARHGIDVIHACNPPETFWVIGFIYKVFGKKFIFDHHDLSPEMYYSRFGKKGMIYDLLLFLERMTFLTADAVITTNETHKKVAVTRGKFSPEKIFIVRSGPDHHKLKRQEAEVALKRGYRFMVTYLGVLNPQDGVDTLLYIADYIINKLGRTDILFVIMGSGDSFVDLKNLASDLKLDSYVHFTGWVEAATITKYLSTSDISVDTMPKNPYSDAATLNKILEYMSVSSPIVAFDLVETRISAGSAAVYAIPDDIIDFAENLLGLLGSDSLRIQMGNEGRQRVEEQWAWVYQKEVLLAAYNMVLSV